MFKIDWAKLRREWKTFALAVGTTVVGGYDIVVAAAQQYGYDYTQLIKQEYRMYVIPAVAVAFLALRKWTSRPVETKEVPVVEDVKVEDVINQ